MRETHPIKSAARRWRVFAALGFLSGIALGVAIGKFVHLKPASSQVQEIREKGFKFISPLLECEIGEETIRRSLVPFGDELRAYADEQMQSEAVVTLAIYYRDLLNGPWSGVNEKEEFIPASLLKVPLMMAYLKASEGDRDLLQRELPFVEKFEDPYSRTQSILPQEEIQIGESYAVEELIERSIAFSDNQATQLLLRNLDLKWLKAVFAQLSVESDVFTPGPATEDVISIKEYSTFFRILYNASYLTKENSEKALEILSRVGYKDGLVAGVPPDIVVAHKFGEAGFFDTGRQLHDCGIIYHPVRPYMLCVMTRGLDIAAMTKTIREISQMVFNEVNLRLQ